MSQYEALHKALAQCIEQRLTFVAFRLPGQPVQLWAQRDPRQETVESTLLLGLNQVFITAPFKIDPEAIPYIRADVELMFAEIDPDITRLNDCSGTGTGSAEPEAATPKADFIAAVNAAIQACSARQMDKVVLSRLVEADLPPERWPALFTWAAQDNPETLVAMAFTPAHGLWMGASPERLVKEEQDHVRVDAIAATRPSDDIPTKISAWGAKELDEQGQVAHYLHAAFARMDLRNITVRGPEVVKAGPVAHLHTTLEADLGDALLGDLVVELHPTPAIGGVPKEEALRFIAGHERHKRALYTGFWGPWNADGPTELFVNLRCMHHQAGKTLLYVGAGITASSNAELEWAETERKADTWLRALEPSAMVG